MCILRASNGELPKDYVAEDDRASQVERLQSYYNVVFHDYHNAHDDLLSKNHIHKPEKREIK